MSEEIWDRPGSGREPAGAALLSWLADPAAPRLCLLTGGEGCGKSALLAWLVAHGSAAGANPQRRVHGFAPLANQTAATAAWALAQQLSLPTRTPGEFVRSLSLDARRTVLVLPDLHAAEDPKAISELVHHLARHDHIRLVVEVRSGTPEIPSLMALDPAVMDLDHEQWTDATRKAAESETASGRPGVVSRDTTLVGWDGDLADAAAVCASDPWQISRRYDLSEEDHGGLRTAWLRAAGSLTRDQSASDRALTLLAALGDEADPRLNEQLVSLASGAAWRLIWRRVRNDIRPPWPGPVRAMAARHSARVNSLVAADHHGTIRMLDVRDGAPQGRMPAPVDGACSVSARPDGTVLVLDGHGHLHTQHAPGEPRQNRISALFDDAPGPLERLVEAVNKRRSGSRNTAVASSETVLAVADDSGSGYAYALEDEREWHRSAQLHNGAITALTVLEPPIGHSNERAPLIYSGGIDGRVRVWQPATAPLSAPVAMRRCPVTALDAAHTTDSGPVLAIGWADGLVEYMAMDTATAHAFRPGPAVRAVALLHDGSLAVGTDETLVCLQPLRQRLS